MAWELGAADHFSSPPSFLRQGFPLNLELTGSARLVSQWALSSPCLWHPYAYPQCWAAVAHHYTKLLVFMWVQGSKFRSSHLYCKYFTPLSYQVYVSLFKNIKYSKISVFPSQVDNTALERIIILSLLAQLKLLQKSEHTHSWMALSRQKLGRPLVFLCPISMLHMYSSYLG